MLIKPDTVFAEAEDNLLAYMRRLPNYNFQISYSGGKDSTALMGLFFLAKSLGVIERFEVINSDTRMELPFLVQLVDKAEEFCLSQGVSFHRLYAPMEGRFFYKLLGEGVSVPNRSFRWCTDRLKIRPAKRFYKTLSTQGRSYLMYTGERLGESAQRDLRLKAQGCGDGQECGVKDLASVAPEGFSKTPIVHWSLCQVWDFIAECSLCGLLHDVFDQLSYLYSRHVDAKNSLRTGCIGCPLVRKDHSLAAYIESNPEYQALESVHSVYKELSQARHRLVRPDGKSAGAIKISSRRWALDQLLAIESQVRVQVPEFRLIQEDELALIQYMLDQGYYPRGYTGMEPCATTLPAKQKKTPD